MEKYVAYAADTHEYDFFPTFEAAAQWILGDDWSEGYSQELIDGESYIAEITHVTDVKVTDRKENYPLNGEEWPYGSFDWIGEPYMKKVEDEVERLTPTFEIGETVIVDVFDGYRKGRVKAISEIEYSISFDTTNKANRWFPESQIDKL